MADDPLELDAEQMRRMGYAVVDLLVRRVAGLADGPVLTMATRAEMEARIDEPAPAGANDFVGSSRVDLQACKLEYSIVSPK